MRHFERLSSLKVHCEPTLFKTVAGLPYRQFAVDFQRRPLIDGFIRRDIRLEGHVVGYQVHMTDPRNIAHDKKVASDKTSHGEDVAQGSDQTPQPGRKPHMEHHASDPEAGSEADPID